MNIDPPRLYQPRLGEGEADDFERLLLAAGACDAGAADVEVRTVAAFAAALAGSASVAAASALPTAAFGAPAGGHAAVAGTSVAGTSVAGTSLAGTSVTTASVTGAGLAKWLGVGLFAGLAAAGATEQVASRMLRPVPTTAAVAAPRPVAERGPVALAPVAPVLPRPERGLPAAVATAATAPPSGLTNASARADAPDTSLADELGWLDAARTALGRGQPGAALEALDARARQHPDGALGPEATLLRVQALLARGEREAARRVAEPWLASGARGAHLERLRALLEQDP